MIEEGPLITQVINLASRISAVEAQQAMLKSEFSELRKTVNEQGAKLDLIVGYMQTIVRVRTFLVGVIPVMSTIILFVAWLTR